MTSEGVGVVGCFECGVGIFEGDGGRVVGAKPTRLIVGVR